MCCKIATIASLIRHIPPAQRGDRSEQDGGDLCIGQSGGLIRHIPPAQRGNRSEQDGEDLCIGQSSGQLRVTWCQPTSLSAASLLRACSFSNF
ncbi:unnamed protein product [Gongylonema pulchrum]|uniref:Secreted protein n=1 Tax=Gongylonema pulchrum TaxID=637853 RepID=A0A183EY52_9BILA|nr:unnamed protein product [Gongylonema pulchrum]